MLFACGDDGDSTAAGTTASEPSPATLSVSVEPSEAAPGGTVDATVVNGTEKEFTYGADFELERVLEGEGTEPVSLPNRPIPAIGYVAARGESGPAVSVELPDDLPPGTYRIVIQRNVPGVGDLSGELQVVDG